MLKEEGRPPFHPSVLLKLYMYGYKHGIRTSRKLEHACKVNVELWWLLEGQIPSDRTIAAFRKENKKAFKNAFRYFVLMLKEWDLIGGETIAIDSFKIRAQNSLKNNFNRKKIDRHIEYIDNKIEEYEKQIEQAEEEEKQEIEDKISYQQQKKDKYEKLEEELQNSGKSQISLTDPDAKSVILHKNIINVGYNIQAASDAKHKLLMTQRQAIVEHPYGTIKRQWGFNYILTKKGIKRASADAGLMFVAYNIRRIMNILGKDELKKYLEVLILLVLSIYCQKWAKLSRSDISIFFNKIVTDFFKVTLNRLIFV